MQPLLANRRRNSANLGCCEPLEPRHLLSGGYTFITKATFDGFMDGNGPTVPPILDSAGDLFGTTTGGGANYDGNVYELPAGSSTPINLYSFDGGALGEGPLGNIAMDSAGDIFGVTGPFGDLGTATTDQTTVWELQKTASGYTPLLLQTLLHTEALGGVTITPNGNVYGACTEISGDMPTQAVTFIFELTGAPGSAYTYSSLVPASDPLFGGVLSPMWSDSHGNLFASDSTKVIELAQGANVPQALGTIPGTYGNPTYGVSEDSAGDLFGTSTYPNEVYEYTSGTVSIVTTTNPNSTGAVYPDLSGDLIGTSLDDSADDGSIFEIPSGSGGAIQVLHTFTGGADGAAPSSFLTEDSSGDLFGVTEAGGTPVDAEGDTGGTIFELQAPQPSTQLVFNQPPTAITTGTSITPPITVDIEDVNGSIVTTDTSTVTLSIASGPAGAVLGGTVTEPAATGEATFSDITLSVPGTYTVTASDGALASATSTGFLVSAGVNDAPAPDPSSARLKILTVPRKPVADSLLSPSLSVEVLNAKGKLVTTDESAVTLMLRSGPTGAALGGMTAVAAVNGIATFTDLSFSTAGKYVLTATDAKLKSANTPAIVVAPLPPESMVFTQPPTAVSAGAAFTGTVGVELLDKNGMPVTSNHTTVRLTIASGPTGGKLTGGSAVVRNGVATFSNLRLTLVGSYSLSAIDGAIPSITSTAFSVTAAAPHKATFIAPVTVIAPGVPVSFTADEIDRYNNISTEDASDLVIDLQSQPKDASTQGYALLGGADDDGAVTFTGSPLIQLGFYVFTLKDTADPSLHSTVTVHVK